MLANTPCPVNKNFIRYIEMFYSEQQKEQSMRREIIRLGLSFLLPEPIVHVRPKPSIGKWEGTGKNRSGDSAIKNHSTRQNLNWFLKGCMNE